MKTRYSFLLIAFCCYALSFAQPGDGRVREKIRSLHVAFVTEAIDLEPEEAQDFWPVYNQMRDQRFALEESKRKLIRKIDNDMQGLSDEKAQGFLKELDDIESQLAGLNRIQANQPIIDLIGARRFLLLKKAEQDFKRKMLDEFQKRKRGMRRR